MADLEPAPPVRRYQCTRPGGLLHLDIKKLGRFWRPGHRVTGDRRHASAGAGWEFVHVVIDDASRVAFASLHPDEQRLSACAALLTGAVLLQRDRRARHANHDRQWQLLPLALLSPAGAGLNLKHLFTKPYTPRTNGKAERFIQTALREWACARSYEASDHRAQHLPLWLHDYNWHRPHASLDYRPPISRIPISLNNELGLHS